MTRIVLAAVVLVLSAVTASAADLAARPVAKAPPLAVAVTDWSGVYIGGNGGGGWGRTCFDVNTFTIDLLGLPMTVTGPEGCHTASGATAGGQIGYRWQTASWVFGVEAQGDWANLKGSNASLTALIPYTNQTKIDAIGLLTGQVGYAWNNVLLYVKGGAAVTDNKYSSFFTATGIPFNQTSDTRWGGAVGTGIEVSFASNWSVAVEYDHLFMGNPSVTFPATNSAVSRSDNIRQDVDMGTVRLNYRFGGPVIAKY